jgi:hypothetical protein
VSTPAICSSSSANPIGGISPMAPSFPFSRMRTGMPAGASSIAEPISAGATRSWPRPSGWWQAWQMLR